MSSDGYGFSDVERKIINAQIQRRAKMRKEFLKQRSDPYKNSMEAGHVFDPAIQRFMSMKVSTLDYFEPNFRTISFVLGVFAPMGLFGYLIWKQRTERESQIRSGKLKYIDRLFKLVA